MDDFADRVPAQEVNNKNVNVDYGATKDIPEDVAVNG